MLLTQAEMLVLLSRLLRKYCREEWTITYGRTDIPAIKSAPKRRKLWTKRSRKPAKGRA